MSIRPGTRTRKSAYAAPKKRRRRDLAAIERWVERWKTTGRVLRRIRDEEIRRLTTRQVQEAMLSFDDAVEDALRRSPNRTSSGLVVQQALFRRLPK
jgi:hypothetical protein